MNKTFKVVFNRARAGLMVANEITSSVQKKGTKTVVVVAAGLLAMLGSAEAAERTQTVITDSTVIESVSNATNTTTGTGDSWGGGIYQANDYEKALNVGELTFAGNTFQDADKGRSDNVIWMSGGVFYLYQRAKSAEATFTGTHFVGNTLIIRDTSVSNPTNKNTAWVSGGALTIKGMKVEFKDVAFNNNKVEATVVDSDKEGIKGAAATGGALILDRTISGSYNKPADVVFAITKDTAYTGNTVSSESKNYAQAAGGYNTTSGGFMYMDRPSSATFDITKGATLTLGVADATNAVDDSIASSIHGTDKAYEGSDNVITKTGAGRFVVNSTLNDYFGTVVVESGEMSVARDWKIKNAVTVGKESSAGAKLVLNGKVEFGGFIESAKEKKIEKTVRNTTGSLKVLNGGELVTAVGNVFSEKVEGSSETSDASLTSQEVTKKADFTFEKGSILTLTDEGQYKIGLLNSLAKEANSNHSTDINLPNASVTLEGTTGDVEINANVTTLALSGDNKITINKSLTLNGAGETSSINELEFTKQGNAQLLAKNNTIVNVETLTGNGRVSVGEREGAGAKMFINNLAMTGGRIFVDPYYGHSVLGINALESDTLSTSIIAGDGALVTIGTASEADARAALAKVDGAASAKSVVFMKKAISIGQGGSFYIDPAATDNSGLNYPVHVGADGLLAVDQGAVGDNPVFGASLVHFEGGKLAVINAAPGTLTMVAPPPDRYSESRYLAWTCGRSRPDG